MKLQVHENGRRNGNEITSVSSNKGTKFQVNEESSQV